MAQDDIERVTAEGLHEIADMPGENSYFAHISSEDLSVWVCGLCSLDDCDWTEELITEDSEALNELAKHLHEKHGVFARIATEEVGVMDAPAPERSSLPLGCVLVRLGTPRDVRDVNDHNQSKDYASDPDQNSLRRLIHSISVQGYRSQKSVEVSP